MFKNPFSFKGRIRRLEYGISLIISYIMDSILLAITRELLRSKDTASSIIFILIIFAVVAWFFIAQAVKRCHDMNSSGFYILIPFYGLILLFAGGTVGPNRYGDDPKNPEINQQYADQTYSCSHCREYVDLNENEVREGSFICPACNSTTFVH